MATKMTFKTQYDYIGLSTEEKPSENVPDGSTFLEVDKAIAYIFYQGTWYAL